jgi:hypothetical protein
MQMHLETSSNLYGVTVNPYNRHLTSGGSSGGEGALIGLHGSCLGIGEEQCDDPLQTISAKTIISRHRHWWQHTLASSQ